MKINIFIVLIFLNINIFGQTIYDNNTEDILLDIESNISYTHINIILEMAMADTIEQKIYALEIIEEYINQGVIHNIFYTTLEYLSMEGIRNIIYNTSGQIINDLPDIRKRSVIILGQLETKEAKTLLNLILQYEKEPIIIQEIKNSLNLF